MEAYSNSEHTLTQEHTNSAEPNAEDIAGFNQS